MKDEKQFCEYLSEKSVRVIPGIGGKTQNILNKFGIHKLPQETPHPKHHPFSMSGILFLK